jgi:hypothetical protein
VVHFLYASIAASRAHAITQRECERGRVLYGQVLLPLEWSFWARTDDWILSQEAAYADGVGREGIAATGPSHPNRLCSRWRLGSNREGHDRQIFRMPTSRASQL